MTKYTNPDKSDEFQELSDERVKEDNPYDSWLLYKMELNNNWLSRNRPAVTKDFFGSGHDLTGNDARIGNRPFTSIKQISSFIQIPWFRNVGAIKLRIYLYCRIGDWNVENEGGDLTGPSYVQASFASEPNPTDWTRTDVADDGLVLLNNGTSGDGIKIHPGEWQWIQFDYKVPDIETTVNGKWDVLQIGFGSLLSVDDNSFTEIVNSYDRVSAGREYAVKTDSDSFSWDTAASSPEIDSWQISGLLTKTTKTLLLSPFTAVPTLDDQFFMPAATMVYEGSSAEYKVLCLWPSSDLNILKPTSTENTGVTEITSQLLQTACPYIQVRSIHIQEVGSDFPPNRRGPFFRPERPTKNEAPYALSKKISNITSRKECIVPFSKGYKPAGLSTYGGNQWTGRYQWMKHAVTKGGTGRSSVFQELGTSPKVISKVDFALTHTSFHNDLPSNNGESRTRLFSTTVDTEKASSEYLEEGIGAYIKFIARVKQLNKTSGDFEEVNSKTEYKKTKFIRIKDNPTWVSQHIFSNQMKTMLDTDNFEGFCWREGMFTMPGYGGNQGENDRFLLLSPLNNTVITVDVSDIDQHQPLLFELDIEIQVSNDDYPIEFTGQINTFNLFTNLVGCSVWGY